jgi:hypothetical protein
LLAVSQRFFALLKLFPNLPFAPAEVLQLRLHAL